MVAPIIQEYEKKLEDLNSQFEAQRSQLEDQKSQFEKKLENQLYNFAINMLKKTKHTVDEIAQFTGTPIELVKTAKKELDSK